MFEGGGYPDGVVDGVLLLVGGRRGLVGNLGGPGIPEQHRTVGGEWNMCHYRDIWVESVVYIYGYSYKSMVDEVAWEAK